MKIFILVISLILMMARGYSQDFEVTLWPEGSLSTLPMGSETREYGDIVSVRNVRNPGIAVYLPAKRQSTGQAVLICPGGGYQMLAYDWEGVDIARWFNSKGIAAIVLRYRLPVPDSLVVMHEAPLEDAQRALRLVRFNSEGWNIDKNQIGVIGFSAGGHLAATLGTRYDHVSKDPVDAIDLVSARPDFMMLIYPVITMREDFTHFGSRDALLGEEPADSLVNFYSNELHVNSDTPPGFLVHSGDDKAVPVDNSLFFYQALKNQGIPAEMHIYPSGGHGYSLAIGKGYLQTWTDRMHEWLQNVGRRPLVEK